MTRVAGSYFSVDPARVIFVVFIWKPRGDITFRSEGVPAQGVVSSLIMEAWYLIETG